MNPHSTLTTQGCMHPHGPAQGRHACRFSSDLSERASYCAWREGASPSVKVSSWHFAFEAKALSMGQLSASCGNASGRGLGRNRRK